MVIVIRLVVAILLWVGLKDDPSFIPIAVAVIMARLVINNAEDGSIK